MLSRISVGLLLVAAMVVLGVGCAAQNKAPAVKPYMLSTCLVADEPLGSMNSMTTFTYEGQEVKFCCGACEAEFKKDPAKYIKKLADAGNKPATKPS